MRSTQGRQLGDAVRHQRRGPSIRVADFFDRLCHDPDLQIPAIFASPGGRVAASTEYRVYRELCEAVRRADSGRASRTGPGD